MSYNARPYSRQKIHKKRQVDHGTPYGKKKPNDGKRDLTLQAAKVYVEQTRNGDNLSQSSFLGSLQFGPCRRTFNRYVKILKANSYSGIPKLGRPTSLTNGAEERLLVRLKELQNEFSHLTNNMIIREALDIAREPAEGETHEDIATRVSRCGGDDWLHSYKERHNLRTNQVHRPMELERAMKNQPEITLKHWRMVIHTFAVMQIHRAMANNYMVIGWHWDETRLLATRVTGDSEPGDDVVESKMVDGIPTYWVKPLNEPLVFPSPKAIFNVDEKSILPDSPLRVAINNLCIAYGRTSSWTLVLPLLANGSMDLPVMLILRGESVETSITQLCQQAGITVTSTKKGMQDDDTFANYLTILLPKIGATHEYPGCIFLDGHSSRLTTKAIEILRKHHIYALIEPSQTSTTHQALDNGANAIAQQLYNQNYTTAIAQSPEKKMSNMTRVKCIVRTITEMREMDFSHCWEQVGIINGKLDPRWMTKKKKFRYGERFRENHLLPLSDTMLEKLFSVENICAAYDAPILMPVSSFQIIPPKVLEYVNQNHTDKLPDQSMASYITKRTGKSTDTIHRILFTRLQSNSKRYEILVGEDNWVESQEKIENKEPVNEKKQYSGRLSTKEGRVLYGDAAQKEIMIAENKAKEKQEKKKKKDEVEVLREAEENTLTKLLKQLSFCPTSKKKLTLSQMQSFARQNNIQVRGKRKEVVTQLLLRTKDKIEWRKQSLDNSKLDEISDNEEETITKPNSIPAQAPFISEREILSAQHGVILCDCKQLAFCGVTSPSNEQRPNSDFFACATDGCLFFEWATELYNHNNNFFAKQNTVVLPPYTGRRLCC
jgi:hypothetical protein